MAVAVVFMIQGHTTKARNQLKRIAKMNYLTEMADDFEKSWLMLASIYVEGLKKKKVV